MNYQHKTKEQLIEEINRLNDRIRHLEKTIHDVSSPEIEVRSNTCDTILIGSWEFNINNGKIFYTRELEKILGLNSKQKIHSLNDIVQFVYEEDRWQFQQTLGKAISEKDSFSLFTRYQNSDGAIVKTLTQVEPILRNNKHIKMLGNILDLSKFKKLHLNPLDEYNQYQILFELSPSGIIVEDETGTIIDVNPSFCQALGYTCQELIGEKVHILAHPDVRHQVDSNISQLLSGKVLKHNEKSIRKDGVIRFMELNETKITLSNGKAGILCIAEDVTEKVKAQEERIQREKLQGVLEMAGAVCHEINQPLTTIYISSDLVLDFSNKKNLKENVAIIKNEAIRIGKITEKLMNITKYETRDYINGFKIFDLDKASREKKKREE